MTLPLAPKYLVCAGGWWYGTDNLKAAKKNVAEKGGEIVVDGKVVYSKVAGA